MADAKDSTPSLSNEEAIKKEAALDATKLLEKHEIKDHPQLPPKSHLPKAFGNWSFEEIAMSLGDPKRGKGSLREQGLSMLLQMCKRPTDTIKAVKFGLVQKVEDCLDHPLALDVMLQLTRQRYSRTELLTKTNIVESLVSVAEKGEVACRLGSYKCLWELSQYQGLSHERKLSIVSRCIGTCDADKEAKIKVAALAVLKMMITRQGVLKEGEACITTVTGLLGHRDALVSEYACEALEYVCVSPTGKAGCIKAGAVPKLTANLDHDNKRVRMFASASLMHISLLKEGKLALIEAKTVPVLLKRLSDEPAIQNYTLQALTSMFQHPSVREQVKGSVENKELIETLAKSSDPLVAGSAKSALDQLLWMP
mmetsp:Transcript_24658/g.59342  ORF Transcript_24658/g.59342 Transcript_24658/m.59342 type:complete len:368 (-) Transcript_24658:58-1161(-)